MQDVGAPRGIGELGYTEDDVPALVDGAMKQQRLLVGSPREVSEKDIAHVLNASMTNW
jgi:hydroxyacid-oxoacid transhydrogenase